MVSSHNVHLNLTWWYPSPLNCGSVVLSANRIMLANNVHSIWQINSIPPTEWIIISPYYSPPQHIRNQPHTGHICLAHYCRLLPWTVNSESIAKCSPGPQLNESNYGNIIIDMVDVVSQSVGRSSLVESHRPMHCWLADDSVMGRSSLLHPHHPSGHVCPE